MSGRALAEIKSAKDFSKFRKKAYRLDFAQDAVAPTGLISKLHEVRWPCVILNCILPFVLSSLVLR